MGDASQNYKTIHHAFRQFYVKYEVSLAIEHKIIRLCRDVNHEPFNTPH